MKRSEGEGQSAKCEGWKDQGCCDLLFLVVGHSYYLPLRLGQPTPVAIHLLIITGVPWRLSRNLGEDATLTNILQILMSTVVWWWHSMPLVRSSIPSSKDLGSMWLSSECTCCSRYRYFSQNTWEGFNRSTWSGWNKIISMRAWTPNISACWLTKWMENTLLATLTCSCGP